MNAMKPTGIIKKLNMAGYEAYYVGGCVRDILLQRKIHDWDITTSAMPEEIMACFPHCIATGIQHGTVTVLDESGQAEVTTFRTDGSYLDGRHPEQVTFVRSLSEDLSRRDFTINAMAMQEDGTVIDLYKGQEDLAEKRIRCVGDPERRFREDALRMFRALRFSAQLGFEIEAETLRAIKRCAPLCEKLSMERIRDEVEKTLLSDRPDTLGEMIALGLLNLLEPQIVQDLSWLRTLPHDRRVRWAGLCRCWPSLQLSKLRLDKRMTVDATEASKLSVPVSRLDWKFLIAEKGEAKASILASLAGEETRYQEIILSGECLSLRNLAVNGSDFLNMDGKDIGNHLKKLLHYVLEHPEGNTRENLLEISKNSIDYYY